MCEEVDIGSNQCVNQHVPFLHTNWSKALNQQTDHKDLMISTRNDVRLKCVHRFENIGILHSQSIFYNNYEDKCPLHLNDKTCPYNILSLVLTLDTIGIYYSGTSVD